MEGLQGSYSWYPRITAGTYNTVLCVLSTHSLCFTTLHCTTLKCIIMFCIALHCSALPYAALHCIALHYTRLQFSAMHCISCHCTALNDTEQHCIIMHWTVEQYILCISYAWLPPWGGGQHLAALSLLLASLHCNTLGV